MISKEQLRHLSNLAKIELDDSELEKLQKDLNEILVYVEQVEKLAIDDIETMSSGPLQEILLREDIVQDKDIEVIKQIISAFPEKENGYLKVPKILNK